jgi:hypothetical protein
MEYNPLLDYGIKDLSIEENLIYYKFSEMIKILIIISSNANKQKEFIGIGHATDEMAIDFDTYYTQEYQNYIGYGLINSLQKIKLDELDTYFENKSNQKDLDFWDDSKLDSNPDWELVREKAKEILTALNKENLAIDYFREEEYDELGKLTIQTTRIKLIEKATFINGNTE